MTIIRPKITLMLRVYVTVLHVQASPPASTAPSSTSSPSATTDSTSASANSSAPPSSNATSSRAASSGGTTTTQAAPPHTAHVLIPGKKRQWAFHTEDCLNHLYWCNHNVLVVVRLPFIMCSGGIF